MLKIGLITLILLTINTSYSFSQTDTTKVTLPVETVRLVIKDLIQGDFYKKELELIHEKSRIYEVKLDNLESIITTQNNMIVNYQKLLLVKDNQIRESNKVIQELNFEVRKLKNKNNITTIGSGILLGVILVSVIIN